MINDPASIEPRKRPSQGRSVATVDAVLEASAHILQDGGLAALNTNEIARRAGVSIGSLYQYFPTKEAILAEIVRRKRSSLLDGLTGAVDATRDRPFEVTLRHLIEVTLAHQTDKPAFARALEYAYAALPLQRETEELNDKIVVLIADLLRRQGHRDARQSAIDVVAIVRGMIEAASLRGETDRSALVERVCRAVIGFLSPDGRS